MTRRATIDKFRVATSSLEPPQNRIWPMLPSRERINCRFSCAASKIEPLELFVFVPKSRKFHCAAQTSKFIAPLHAKRIHDRMANSTFSFRSFSLVTNKIESSCSVRLIWTFYWQRFRSAVKILNKLCHVLARSFGICGKAVQLHSYRKRTCERKVKRNSVCSAVWSEKFGIGDSQAVHSKVTKVRKTACNENSKKFKFSLHYRS